MSLEANKALVRRYLEEVYAGNFDILDEVLAEEYVGTRPAEWRDGDTLARYKANFGEVRRAFPDIQLRFEALIAEGDWVAMHWRVEGTHLGEFRGLPPTGKHASWTATAFRRVREGKIVQGYATFDWLGVLRQLGVTFVPPDPPA